jgi:hypothetical protein
VTIVVTSQVDFNFGPAQDQGRRPTCLAFSLSDLNQFSHSSSAVFSAEYLYRSAAGTVPQWKPGDGLPIRAGVNAVGAPGQPEIIYCPYEVDEPSETPPSVPVVPAPLFGSPIRTVASPKTSVCAALQNGRPIGLVVRLLTSFYQPVDGRIAMNGHLVDGLHALVATALGHDVVTKDEFVLVRNSWGASWGIGGCAWLPMAYVHAYATHAFEV